MLRAIVETIEQAWNRILLFKQRILQLSRQLSRLRGRLLCLGVLGFCRHASPPAGVVASSSTHA